MNEEFKELYKVPMVFLLAAIVLVLGILILSGFQTTQLSTVSVVNESLSMPALNGTKTLSHYRVSTITSIKNITGGVYGTGNYTIVSSINSTIQFNYNTTPFNTTNTIYVTYDYQNYDTGTPLAITNMQNALSELPNNWFTLIAIILVAGIIIGITLSFSSKNERF